MSEVIEVNAGTQRGREVSADEKKVREMWPFLETCVRDLDSYGTDQFNIYIYTDKCAYVGAAVYIARFQEDDTKIGHSKAWSAAAAFTRQRQREIAEAKEDVQLVQCMIILLKAEKDDTTHMTWKRILAREQAHLDNLCRGIVEEGKAPDGR